MKDRGLIIKSAMTMAILVIAFLLYQFNVLAIPPLALAGLTVFAVSLVVCGRSYLQSLTITLGALLLSLVLFGAFMFVYNKVSPLDLYYFMYRGGFGTRSAWSDTLSRAALLILTALCTALPARLGLIVIGGEGSLVLGGLAAAAVGLGLAGLPPLGVQVGMALAGMAAGGLVIGLVGALSHGRGVNATISSLLLVYVVIGVFSYVVEGPMRDPASLNKPSTYPISDEVRVGNIMADLDKWTQKATGQTAEQLHLGNFIIPNLRVHWGLVCGVLFCLFAYILMEHTTFGFAARMAGGNVRAAQAAGLPVGRLIIITCLIGGAAAGLAGAMEIAAVQGQANATLIAGYGFTGILVSFIARHHPLAIIPAAILFGGLDASGGALQRRLELPDASVKLLMGIIFVLILLFETFYGRFHIFEPRQAREVATA